MRINNFIGIVAYRKVLVLGILENFQANGYPVEKLNKRFHILTQ